MAKVEDDIGKLENSLGLPLSRASDPLDARIQRIRERVGSW